MHGDNSYSFDMDIVGYRFQSMQADIGVKFESG